MSNEQKQSTGLPECTLTNEQLIEKAQEWVKKLCDTGGRAWSLRVPADHNVDPDLLITALCKRLSESEKYSRAMEGIEDPAAFVKYVNKDTLIEVEKINRELLRYKTACEAINKDNPMAVAENLEETVKALKNLIFTASKLWDDTKPIQDTEIITFTHPIIEEAKELLTNIQSK